MTKEEKIQAIINHLENLIEFDSEINYYIYDSMIAFNICKKNFNITLEEYVDYTKENEEQKYQFRCTSNMLHCPIIIDLTKAEYCIYYSKLMEFIKILDEKNEIVLNSWLICN